MNSQPPIPPTTGVADEAHHFLALNDIPNRAAILERFRAVMRPKGRPLMLFCHRLVTRLLRSGDFITVTETEYGGTRKLDQPLPPLFRSGILFLERILDEHGRTFGTRYLRVVDAGYGHWSLVAPLAWWNAPMLALLWMLTGLERAEAWLFHRAVRLVGISIPIPTDASAVAVAPGEPWSWLWGPCRTVSVTRAMLMTRIRRKPVASGSTEPEQPAWLQRGCTAFLTPSDTVGGVTVWGAAAERDRQRESNIVFTTDSDAPPQHWPTPNPQTAMRRSSAGLWAPLNPAVRGLHDILATIEALDGIPSDAHVHLLKSTWASVMTLLRDAPADQRPSPSLLRDVASRLDALGLLDPAARTFEVLDELAPDTEAALFRNGYPEAVAAVVLALVRHDERAAFETYMRLIDGPVGMTMDEAWEGTRRRLAKA